MAKKSKTRSKSLKAYYRSKKSYNRYVDLYRKREAMLQQRGYDMYDEMLTFTEYKTAAPDMRNTLKEKVRIGKRKSVGDINKALVSEQAYELSEEQGYAIFNFLKENAEKYNIQYSTKNINEILMKIRQGKWLAEDVGLWDMIKEFREDYFKEHGYSRESREILYGVNGEPGLVSQLFFGSK